jgi:hypothetical protein
MIPVSVFGPVRVIGVPGPEDISQVFILGGIDIRVVGDHGNRRAGGRAFEYAGMDFGAILFITRRCDLALTDPSPVELMLDVLHGERNTCGTPFDNDA